MFGKKNVITLIAGFATIALPAYSQTEELGNNEISVQAFGSFVKSAPPTTASGIPTPIAAACSAVIVTSSTLTTASR